MAKIRVTMYMPNFAMGGAENALISLANYWTEHGNVQPSFIVNTSVGPSKARLSSLVPVHSLGHKSTLRNIVKLASVVKNDRPDILATALLEPNIAGFFAARVFSPSTTTVPLIRNFTSAELRRNVKGRIISLPLKWALQNSKAIGAVSQDVADDLVNIFNISPLKIHTTLNSIRKLSEKEAIIKPRDVPTLVAVGRLVPQKDYHTLLNAIHLVSRSTEIKLKIVGEGPLRGELENLVGELHLTKNVQFLGSTPFPEEWVRGADAFVITSLFEGFPNVIAESLSVGTTVVATDAPGGARDILGDGKFGYLVVPGDANSVAAGILKALNYPISKEILRNRAADFGIESIAQRYERLFSFALKSD